MFFKVFGSPEPFLQKGFWWGAGVKPLLDKSKFENHFALGGDGRRVTTYPEPKLCRRHKSKFENHFSIGGYGRRVATIPEPKLCRRHKSKFENVKGLPFHYTARRGACQ